MFKAVENLNLSFVMCGGRRMTYNNILSTHLMSHSSPSVSFGEVKEDLLIETSYIFHLKSICAVFCVHEFIFLHNISAVPTLLCTYIAVGSCSVSQMCGH